VSYSDVLAHLNIPSASANEDEVRRFIDAAEDLAEQYCGLVLGRRTFTSEKYDGGVDNIRLANAPILSVSSVYENGVLLNSSEYKIDATEQRLYRLNSGVIGSSSYGYWATGVDAVVVTYTAGFLITPPTIQQGVLEIIRHLWQTQRGAVGVIGLSQSGDEFSSGSTYSLPRRAQELLDSQSLPGMA
jgi:hypothetical protein